MWYKESKRHSLASRGIKTRGDSNLEILETMMKNQEKKPQTNYTIFFDSKKKKQLLAQRQKEEALLRQNPEVYQRYLDIYDKSDKEKARRAALEKLEEEAPSKDLNLNKLEKSYELNATKPGVTGISLQGIRRTSKVEAWIEEKEREGVLEDKGHMLKFPKDESLMRY